MQRVTAYFTKRTSLHVNRTKVPCTMIVVEAPTQHTGLLLNCCPLGLCCKRKIADLHNPSANMYMGKGIHCAGPDHRGEVQYQ